MTKKLILILFFLLPVSFLGKAQEIEESPATQIFVFSVNPNNEKQQTTFKIKNGTNISYKGIYIFNHENQPIEFIFWETGIIKANDFQYIEYFGKEISYNFEIKLGNKTVLSGFLRFVSKNFDEDINDIAFDLGAQVENLPFFILRLIVSGVPGIFLGGSVAYWYRRRKKEEIEYL